MNARKRTRYDDLSVRLETRGSHFAVREPTGVVSEIDRAVADDFGGGGANESKGRNNGPYG
jgi:hypothetical protein